MITPNNGNGPDDDQLRKRRKLHDQLDELIESVWGNNGFGKFSVSFTAHAGKLDTLTRSTKVTEK